MKMLRILTLIFLSIYNSVWANDPGNRKSEYVVVTRGNMISLMKINNENNRTLLKSQAVSTKKILDLVFVGIIEFEKGRRRDDPKGFYKGRRTKVGS
jgi:hypothetical protein